MYSMYACVKKVLNFPSRGMVSCRLPVSTLGDMYTHLIITPRVRCIQWPCINPWPLYDPLSNNETPSLPRADYSVLVRKVYL